MNNIPFEIIGTEAITLEKGAGDEWIISGFPASEQEDFDKDVLERTGVMKGLDHFFRVGGWIDYDHQYPKTKDPKFLIGTATDRTTDKDGRPIVIGKLFQHKELAKSIYDDMGAGGKYGFSMWGQGVRDPKNPKRITHTLINLLTIAPMPKGYDQTLVKKGFPSGTLHTIAKALDEDWDLEKGETAEEDGSPVKCEGCGKPLNPVEMVMGKYPVCMKCVGKRHGIDMTPVPGGEDGGTKAVRVKKSFDVRLANAITEHIEKANSEGLPMWHVYKNPAGWHFMARHEPSTESFSQMQNEGSKHRASFADLGHAMAYTSERNQASGNLGIEKGVDANDVSKAMVAGDGIVEPGANIGASALKKQELKGARTCKGCGKGLATTTTSYCPDCEKLGKKETGVTAVQKSVLRNPKVLRELLRR